VVGFGIPFAIGPIGGNLSSPPGFVSGEDTTGGYAELLLRENKVLRLEEIWADALAEHGRKQAANR